MYHYQPKNSYFYILAECHGTKKKVNVSDIVKQTRVLVVILWKRVNDKVCGMGHMSGGPQ